MSDRELAENDIKNSASSVWKISLGFREVFLAELFPSKRQSAQTHVMSSQAKFRHPEKIAFVMGY